MANNLSVTHLQNKKPDQALQAALDTDKIFETHDDHAKQGMALGNIGSAYEALGNLDQAVDYYQRSIEVLDKAGETEFRSLVQKSLATIQIKQGEHLAGIFSMQKSLDGKKNLAPREKWLKRLLKLPFKFLGK
jgi:tetratricopeptide (TPR) repeat protein